MIRGERDIAVETSAVSPECNLTDGTVLQVSSIGSRLWDTCLLVYGVAASVQTATKLKEQGLFFFSGQVSKGEEISVSNVFV